MMYRTTSYAANAWDVFWYEKNLQGDIVAVYNSAGTKVATYTYSDAWGNHTVSYTNGGDSTGVIYNPFRYRSYYYDSDLGMYYLQSRYYDAKICRFINADIYVSTGQGILSTNMYSYCNNNPISCVDYKGEFPVHLVIGGIIGGVIGGVSSAISGGDMWDIVFGTISGAASGVLSASGIGVVGQVIGSASISMLSNAAGQIKDIIVGEEKEFNVFDMLFDGAVAGIAAGFAGNGASYGNTAGINSSWKQLFKKGISNSNARQYFYKTAHNANKQFVLDALFESTKISIKGTVIIVGKKIVGKNVLSEALGW